MRRRAINKIKVELGKQGNAAAPALGPEIKNEMKAEIVEAKKKRGRPPIKR